VGINICYYLNPVKDVIGKYTLKQVYPYILLVGGFIGVLSAAILTYEKIEVLKHPAKQLACDLNPVVACGSVINTHQAAAFGFPNPFLGMIGFAIVATTGAAMLAGAKFKRWYWLGNASGCNFCCIVHCLATIPKHICNRCSMPFLYGCLVL
jgi:uncharacterized membrane protein